MLHFYFSISNEYFFSYFILPSFLFFALFAFFEFRLLTLLWKQKNSHLDGLQIEASLKSFFTTFCMILIDRFDINNFKCFVLQILLLRCFRDFMLSAMRAPNNSQCDERILCGVLAFLPDWTVVPKASADCLLSRIQRGVLSVISWHKFVLLCSCYYFGSVISHLPAGEVWPKVLYS